MDQYRNCIACSFLKDGAATINMLLGEFELVGVLVENLDGWLASRRTLRMNAHQKLACRCHPEQLSPEVPLASERCCMHARTCTVKLTGPDIFGT